MKNKKRQRLKTHILDIVFRYDNRPDSKALTRIVGMLTDVQLKGRNDFERHYSRRLGAKIVLQSEALQILEQKIATCTKCTDLAELRELSGWKTVPGVGNPNASVMIIGEAPGKNEAEQGIPFVGKAGRLLTSIIESAGWSREQVFIANILKCRPPGNRDPFAEECDNCRKFLNLQIRCIDPQWILCFGRISSVFLLGRSPNTTIGSLRGKTHDYFGRKVICTYHPSYLLRNPAAKKDVWDDIQLAIFGLQSKTRTV